MLNGCPAIVVPVKPGAPLLAWDSLTLEELWKLELPAEGTEAPTGRFEGVVNVLYEYLDMCIDWDRVVIPGTDAKGGVEGADAIKSIPAGDEGKKKIVRNALELIAAAAVRSGESKEVKKEIDKERSGIAMWRIP